MKNESGYEYNQNIELEYKEISKKDISIINSFSCGYNSYIHIEYYFNENLSFKESKCFDSFGISDLKNLTVCGSAKIAIQNKEEMITLDTCLLMPNVNYFTDNEDVLLKFYKKTIENEEINKIAIVILFLKI